MRLKFLFLFLFACQFSLAQSERLMSFSFDEYRVVLRTNMANYEIQHYNNGVAEVSFYQSLDTLESESHAIIGSPFPGQYNIRRSNNGLHISRLDLGVEAVQIHVDSFPFKIRYFFRDQFLCAHKGFSDDSLGYTLDLEVNSRDKLYGGGARAMKMNRRGKKLTLYNRAHYGYETDAPLMNYCIPMFLSSSIYAVHFDNPGTGYLDLDSKNDNIVQFNTVHDRRVYQIIPGEDWEDLLSRWTYLSGRQPIPPMWSLGNFASRFGYHSQDEVENVVARFKADKIPLDAVILDLYWFGETIKGTMGNLDFFRDSFPEPKQMIDKLHEGNIKTILVTEPFVLTTSKRWKEAVDNDVLAKDFDGEPLTYDFYFGNTGLIDVFSENSRNWFWDRYAELKELGVDGFWGDLGEPEVHPEQMLHETGSANEVHNIYGHRWAQMVYEGCIKNYPQERPFILMRAGSSGSQRYGLLPWSGDVNRTWGGLQSQPGIALQMGLQGVPYMHSDLGGFAGANDDSELYVRWLQYGVFQPIFRPHAQEEVPPEAVFKDTATKSLAKAAIELRYALLPYNYTMAYQATNTGIPLMRPLFFEEELDAMDPLYENDSSYMWGSSLLVSPVLYSGQRVKSVYFPKNANWFDFYSGEKIQGGCSRSVELSMENIPVYVKSNAFVPMTKGLQNTSEFREEEVVIHYFADPSCAQGSGELYHDSDAVEFDSFWQKKRGVIRAESIGGDSKTLNFSLHMNELQLKKVKVNGKRIKGHNKTGIVDFSGLELIEDQLSIEMKVKKVK